MARSAPDLNDSESSEKRESYDLIKGDFTSDEALEILTYLIDKKINFHHRKAFSSEIRFGQVDETSVKRGEELKKSKQKIKKFMKHAQEQGLQVRLSSNVSVEILDSKTES